jgi:hypothetical protein
LYAPSTLIPTGGTYSGAWINSFGDNWARTLVINDSDTRGLHTLINMNITGLSGIDGSVITSGDNYVIGGFTARVITVSAFSQSVQLPTTVGDVTKTVASYFEASTLTRQTNLATVFQGYSFADVVGNDIAAVYKDTFPDVFWISDAAFAGSNTSGTLQIEIEELA